MPCVPPIKNYVVQGKRRIMLQGSGTGRGRMKIWKVLLLSKPGRTHEWLVSNGKSARRTASYLRVLGALNSYLRGAYADCSWIVKCVSVDIRCFKVLQHTHVAYWCERPLVLLDVCSVSKPGYCPY